MQHDLCVAKQQAINWALQQAKKWGANKAQLKRLADALADLLRPLNLRGKDQSVALFVNWGEPRGLLGKACEKAGVNPHSDNINIELYLYNDHLVERLLERRSPKQELYWGRYPEQQPADSAVPPVIHPDRHLPFTKAQAQAATVDSDGYFPIVPNGFDQYIENAKTSDEDSTEEWRRATTWPERW